MCLQYFYYSTYTGDIYQSLLIYFFFQVNQIPIILHIIEQPGYMCHLHTVYSKITGLYVILNKS